MTKGNGVSPPPSVFVPSLLITSTDAIGGVECPNDYEPSKVSLPSISMCDGTENRLADCGAGPKPTTCNCSSLVWVQCQPSEQLFMYYV